MSSPASAAGAAWSPATPISSPQMQPQPPSAQEPGAPVTSPPGSSSSAVAPTTQRGQRTPRTGEASPVILPQPSLPIALADTRIATVPPASGSSLSASPAFSPAQSTPPAASMRPFSLPPATRAGFGSPMFYSPSPALRYSVSSALAHTQQSSVVQRAAGSETTVFAPISGSRRMFDGGKGGGIIEDYNAPPPSVAPPAAAARSGAAAARASPPLPPRSSPQSVLQPAVQSNLSSPPTSDAPAAPTPAARGGLSSFFGSIGSLFTGGLSSSPASTAAASTSSSARSAAASSSPSTLSKTTSIFSFLTLARAPTQPPPQPQPRRQPQQTPQSQPPPRPMPARSATPPSAPISPSDSATSSAPPVATASILSGGFSASGPCILDMPRGLIPLPARGSPEAAEIIALYDADLQPKGRQWIGLLNPLDGWRRSFAPSMYMKLLTASAAAKDPADAESAPSASPSASAATSTAATPRKDDAEQALSAVSATAESSDAPPTASEENAAIATEPQGSTTVSSVGAESDPACTASTVAADDAASTVVGADSAAVTTDPSLLALDTSPPSASAPAAPATAPAVDDSAIPALLHVSSFDGVIEQCIRKDLARTFPSHRLFTHRHGLSVMFNVLRAYARFDPGVGYSQGMAFIVGVLMMHIGPPWEITEGGEAQGERGTLASSPNIIAAESSSSSSVVSAVPCPSEECLFWCLVSLMQNRKHNLQGLYTDDCEGLRLILRVFTAALAETDPQLSAHFDAQGIEVSLFATSWFVSVFSYRFELAFTSCAWSHFLEVGPSFLVVCALGVLRHSRASLLSKHFESLLPFISTVMLPSLPPDLPDVAFAEIDISPALKDQLTPRVTMQGSYKKRR